MRGISQQACSRPPRRIRGLIGGDPGSAAHIPAWGPFEVATEDELKHRVAGRAPCVLHWAICLYDVLDGGHSPLGSVEVAHGSVIRKVVKNDISEILSAPCSWAPQEPAKTGERRWAGSKLAWGCRLRPRPVAACLCSFLCTKDRDFAQNTMHPFKTRAPNSRIERSPALKPPSKPTNGVPRRLSLPRMPLHASDTKQPSSRRISRRRRKTCS